MIECPTCDDEFENETGMKSHHTQVHDESLCYVDVSCDNCGEEQSIHEFSFERSDHHFCNQDCQTEYQKEDNEWKPPVRSGENHPQYESIEVTCSWCGDITEKQPHQIRKAERNFCGLECRAKWQSENMSDENAGQWNGGSPAFYGSNWYEQRREALENANEECERCGMGRDEHYSVFESDLHVHHIKRISTFDVAEEANYQDNLKVLCEDCHMNEHHE